jgi:peroxidase
MKLKTLSLVSLIAILVTTTLQPLSVSAAQQVRQQVNTISAYLDGSVIYGSDKTRAAALRTFINGMLATSTGNLPPLNTVGLPNANDAHIVPDSQLFLAGDVRANENIELSAVQTLFVREHNLIASQIASSSLKLSDEEIYQRTRKIVVGELQAITYNEFLPALLGDGAVKAYTGYKPNVNAGIANEFSTAAFRIGHTIVNDDVEFLDNDGQPMHDEVALLDVFFNPTLIKQEGADPILKYLASDKTQEVDLGLINSLRNFLFGPPGAGGLDLASLNIQRGRDHGLADYNATRKAYGLSQVTTWAQITSSTTLQAKLKSLYGSVNNIDLWVGGLAEDHVPGTSIGSTFRKIIADQFERLRDGDRFWYERMFSGDQLATIKSTKLSDIIKRNTWITNLQDNVFFFDGEDSADLARDLASIANTAKGERCYRETKNPKQNG